MVPGDRRHPRAFQEPLLRSTVTVHYQTTRLRSQRSISAVALERYAAAIHAELATTSGVLAATVDATALPGGASVYVDVTMDGIPLEVLAPALDAIWAAVAQAGQAPELPSLEPSTVDAIRAERA